MARTAKNISFKKEMKRNQNTHPAISFKSPRVGGPCGCHSQHAAGLVSSAGRVDRRSPGPCPPHTSMWGKLGGTRQKICCCQPLVKCKKCEAHACLHNSLARSRAGLTPHRHGLCNKPQVPSPGRRISRGTIS